MDFMLLIVNRKDAPPGEPTSMAEMGQFAGELAAKGKLRGGAPLHPEASGVRVCVRDGRATVTDGPFAEAKEVVGGFFALDARDRAEALEIAARCPHARAGIVEVRAAPDLDAARPSQARTFMLLLHMSPDLSDPDQAKYREMVAFDGVLKDEKVYVESSQLALEGAARVETRAGRMLTSDGPFAESKEVAGGYYIVEARDRDAAVEIATRCPHARWGAVEVREVMKIGPM